MLTLNEKKDFKLTYNSLIPELNKVTDLDFQKQKDSKWVDDIKNGGFSRTKMKAISGDSELGSIKEKGDNIAHFIFIALAIGGGEEIRVLCGVDSVEK